MTIPPLAQTNFLDRNVKPGDSQFSAIQPARPGLSGKVDDPEAIARVAKEFEGMMTGFFLNLMFKSIEKDELLGNNFAQDMYRDLLVEEYGKAISERGSLGIAETVQKQLIQLQASRSDPSADLNPNEQDSLI